MWSILLALLVLGVHKQHFCIVHCNHHVYDETWIIVFMMRRESLCLWWDVNHRVYDETWIIVFMMRRESSCLWWDVNHRVYDETWIIVFMMRHESSCLWWDMNHHVYDETWHLTTRSSVIIPDDFSHGFFWLRIVSLWLCSTYISQSRFRVCSVHEAKTCWIRLRVCM